MLLLVHLTHKTHLNTNKGEKYELLDKENKNIYAYTRTLDKKKILVVLNFSKTNTTFYLPENLGTIGELLINNVKEIMLDEKE